MPRRTRSVVLVALAGALVLGGCDGALLNQYYSLPASPDLQLYSEFHGDWEWELGAESAYPYYNDEWDPSNFTLRVQNGYAIAKEYRQFLQHRDRISGDVEIRIAWHRWVADTAPVRDNYDFFDFRIVLDSGQVTDPFNYVPDGPVVELKLDSFGSPDFDELRIREGADPASEASLVSAPSPGTNTRRGELVVVVRPSDSPPTITATVFSETGLEILSATRDMTQPVPFDPHLTIQLSGSWSEARVIDSVLAMRAR